MVDVDPSGNIVSTLKARARILHRDLKEQDPEAQARLRRLPDLRKLDGEALAQAVQRRHCLKVIARHHGFNGWSHAVEVLTKDEPAGFGKLLCPERCEILTNVWCRSHEEALEAQAQYGGVIFPYMHQFLIASPAYMGELGLDPADPDLAAIGPDWSVPLDSAARRRVCEKIVVANMAWEDG